MTAVVRYVCEGPCGRKRALKFFGADGRRSDGRSRVCLTCQRTRRSTGTHGQRILELYGITEAEYEAILAAQGGRCAICKGVRKYKLDVDHDHALEKLGYAPRDCVRGLLCRQCNRRILRSVRDDIGILTAAIEYLHNPPAMLLLAHLTEVDLHNGVMTEFPKP